MRRSNSAVVCSVCGVWASYVFSFQRGDIGNDRACEKLDYLRPCVLPLGTAKRDLKDAKIMVDHPRTTTIRGHWRAQCPSGQHYNRPHAHYTYPGQRQLNIGRLCHSLGWRGMHSHRLRFRNVYALPRQQICLLGSGLRIAILQRNAPNSIHNDRIRRILKRRWVIPVGRHFR
jgi:hypothetical protein